MIFCTSIVEKAPSASLYPAHKSDAQFVKNNFGQTYNPIHLNCFLGPFIVLSIKSEKMLRMSTPAPEYFPYSDKISIVCLQFRMYLDLFLYQISYSLSKVINEH